MTSKIKEQIALGIVASGARMITEAILSAQIRNEAVTPQQRLYIESMISEIRKIMPETDAKVAQPAILSR